MSPSRPRASESRGLVNLRDLERALRALDSRVRRLIARIQQNGWTYRRPKRIAAYSTSLDAGLLLRNYEPERRALPVQLMRDYEHWYSAARTLIANNHRERVAEFDELYSPKKDASQGIIAMCRARYVTDTQQFRLIEMIEAQAAILAAVLTHLRFRQYDIEITTYSVLMNDEMDAARHLMGRGFFRAAGALVGVMLERHLKNLLRTHLSPSECARANLSRLNETCKQHSVYDQVTWRKIQHLTDLRNLCDHDGEREPTRTDAQDLVDGVSALLKDHTPGRQGGMEHV